MNCKCKLIRRLPGPPLFTSLLFLTRSCRELNVKGKHFCLSHNWQLVWVVWDVGATPASPRGKRCGTWSADKAPGNTPTRCRIQDLSQPGSAFPFADCCPSSNKPGKFPKQLIKSLLMTEQNTHKMKANFKIHQFKEGNSKKKAGWQCKQFSLHKGKFRHYFSGHI